MASLFDIRNDYLELLDLMDDPEMDEESITAALEAKQGELHDKAEQYAMVMKTLEAKSKAYKAEAERCSKHCKTIEGNIRRMKKTLQESMELADDTKFESGLFKFNIRKNAPSLDCDDEAALMNELNNKNLNDYIKVTVEPKKKEILGALKAGTIELDYAGIKQTSSLTIR